MNPLKLPVTRASFVLVLITATLACSCAFSKDKGATSALAASIRITDPALNEQAMGLLSRCVSCHSQASSLEAMVGTGWVAPGNADGSPLYLRVKDGTMPPGNPLGASELATIHDWVQNGMVLQGPAPTPTSPAPPAGLSPLGQRAYTILRTYCAGCHGAGSVGDGGINYILDFNQLISHNLAIPGNAAASPVYTDIATGTMPPGARLSASDTQAVYDWIQTDLRAGGPNPTPSMIPLNATYASISANILIPKCTGCHGAARADEGVRYDTYANTLRTVRVGSPAQSRLFTSVNDGSMPRSAPELTAAEKKAISDWIMAGAANN